MSKPVIYLFYYEDENFFTDEYGEIIYNMFDMITPQDLFMFKYDRGYNLFPHKKDRTILYEIITIPEEICGEQELYIDVGDDYERMERYEKARMSWCSI